MIKYKPYPYQQRAIQHVVDNNNAGLFLDMGLGKTVIMLTVANYLKYSTFDISRVIVIAPLRVAQGTWTDEISKWEHTKHLVVSEVLGTAKKRRAALRVNADIYVINRENTEWLAAELQELPRQDTMLIVDESSSFKNHQSKRFKALKNIREMFKRIVLLTGTPVPNGMIDLWSQVYLLDGGERLGKNITNYRSNYFSSYSPPGAQFTKYTIHEGSESIINAKISDICISMKSEDYLSLPGSMINDIIITMPDELKRDYEAFEREKYLELDGVELTAQNTAAVRSKLMQYAAGAMYFEELAADGFTPIGRRVKDIHSLKLDALDEVIESAGGKPVLVAYSFQFDKDRILKRYSRRMRVKVLTDNDDVKAWNDGKIDLLITHPASASYGLNLQKGSNHCAWYGLNDSLELYEQFNKRLDRNGQTDKVIIHRIISKGTIDESVASSLAGKRDVQDDFMRSIKAKIDYYKSFNII